MIRIGDFARLSHVSVATLRHYDEIGLLKAARVDRVTGYRYYSTAQLPRLNRILALKNLGFSLEQIERALAAGLTADHLRGMLVLKRAESAQRLADEQARLARIEARLRQIEQEDHMPGYDVVLKTVPALLVASRRIAIPTNDQVPALLNPAFNEVYHVVQTAGAKAAGPCFALWYSSADAYADEEVEAVVPIEHAVPENARVRVYQLPQMQVAAVVHHGSFDEFTQGHTALLAWIEANGYRITGPYREIYIQSATGEHASTTEIQFPVAHM
jgi:DNA-binding transcriptional MerR regulator